MPINADQHPGIDLKYFSRPVIAAIDQQWSVLIGIGTNAAILIGIDRHWAMIQGVLTCKMATMVYPLNMLSAFNGQSGH